jgi:hypothetical protein
MPKLPYSLEEEWLDAIAGAHEDKAHLIALLRSDRPLPRAARRQIAELLDRAQLKRPRGRPPDDIYRIALWAAARDYKELRAFKRKKEALDIVAKEHGLPLKQLIEFLDGSGSAAAHFRKRRLPVRKPPD